MTSYRVDFMNEFARNRRIHKVCQRSIVVRSARSPEQAGEAAKTHFAKLEGIRDWRIHAATIEVVPIEDDRVSEMNVPAIDLPSGGKPALSGDRRMLRKTAQAQGTLPALAFDRVIRLVCHRSRMAINF
jgi:hypothetical protein